MEVFILLDRSGSMERIWSEAVSSVNVYVEELGKEESCETCGRGLPIDDYNITLVVFDRHDGFNFDVLRDSMPAKGFKPISADESYPRGSTPLLDALHKLILLAEERNSEKTVMVVMTDGYENTSKEVTKESVTVAMDRVKDKGWQVVFLGAEFDAFFNANLVGVGYGQTISVPSAFLSDAMHKTALHTQSYNLMMDPIAYTDEDRKGLGDFTTNDDS